MHKIYFSRLEFSVGPFLIWPKCHQFTESFFTVSVAWFQISFSDSSVWKQLRYSCYSYATSSCFSPEKNDDDVVSQEKSPMEHVTHQNVRKVAFAGKSFLWFRGIQVCAPES